MHLMPAQTTPSRLSIIEAVQTPLGFFTLGILITEGVILALSPQARGMDFTLLVLGALAGFLVMIAMVFVLTLKADLRHALLGQEKPKAAGRLLETNMTLNDVRALSQLAALTHMPVQEFGKNSLGENPKVPEQRARDLEKRDLVTIRKLQGKSIVGLTEDGADIINAIERIVHNYAYLFQERRGRI